jgi:hypothetical protein
MIVWIASYPRSGNRLCRSTLRHAFRVGPMGFPGGKNPLRKKRVGEILEELGVGPDDDPLAALREYDKPVYLKTHDLPQHIHVMPAQRRQADSNGSEGQDESPALYLVRDGREAIVSFAHYLKEVRRPARLESVSFEELMTMLVRREQPYGGWSGNVGAWRRRSAPTAIIRFEDLAEDAVAAIKAGADSVGLDLPEPKSMLSFNVLKAGSITPSIMRKGQAGGWREEFPPKLLEEFWSKHGEEMDALGYSRE